MNKSAVATTKCSQYWSLGAKAPRSSTRWDCVLVATPRSRLRISSTNSMSGGSISCKPRQQVVVFNEVSSSTGYGSSLLRLRSNSIYSYEAAVPHKTVNENENDTSLIYRWLMIKYTTDMICMYGTNTRASKTQASSRPVHCQFIFTTPMGVS